MVAPSDNAGLLSRLIELERKLQLQLIVNVSLVEVLNDTLSASFPAINITHLRDKLLAL